MVGSTMKRYRELSCIRFLRSRSMRFVIGPELSTSASPSQTVGVRPAPVERDSGGGSLGGGGAPSCLIGMYRPAAKIPPG